MNAFIRAFRTPELRGKILFTLALLAVYRLGVFVPTPGFDYTNVTVCAESALSGSSGSVGLRLIDLGNCFSLNGTDTSRISFEMQSLPFRAPEVGASGMTSCSQGAISHISKQHHAGSEADCAPSSITWL